MTKNLKLTLRSAAVAFVVSVATQPSHAKDIVAFVDGLVAQNRPGELLILHNKEGWLSNIIDTIVVRLKALDHPYSFQGYDQGNRPRDIARNFDWPAIGTVLCMGQYRDCDWIKAEADKKGFEGDFYNFMLDKR